MGVVVRRYIDFLILLIPTPFFFAAASLYTFLINIYSAPTNIVYYICVQTQCLVNIKFDLTLPIFDQTFQN